MDYWHAYPSESESTFAQATNLNVAVPSDWTRSCGLKDVLVQTEATQRKPLLEASSMLVPAAPKLPSEGMSNRGTLEMVPSLTKKIKIEDTISKRRQLYGGWLQGLRDIANDIPSAANRTIKSTLNRNARLPELLKLLMAELERKLAEGDIKTQSAEHGFWASVQDMAKIYGIDFSDFEKLFFSPHFKDLMCLLDGDMPGLIDQGHEGPWSFDQNSFQLTHPCEYISNSFQLTHPCEYNSNSGLVSYLPEYESVAPVEAFPQFPLDTSTANPTAFGQSYFLDYQGTISSVNNPEKSRLYTPGCSQYRAFTHKAELSGPLIINSSTTTPIAGLTPLKEEKTNCFSVCTEMTILPTTVPETCKRKIQRQRRRAMSYNHLTTNFGTLKYSVKRNSGNIKDSDLQFLLEKELKPSDVGTLGRIILPKRQAEEKLPALEVKEGRVLEFEDLQTSQIWSLRFRFWPNNKTRMYVLECTGSFVRTHNLEKGDYMVLYRNPATGKYMIAGRKATAVPKGFGANEQSSIPSSSKGGGGESSFDIALTEPKPRIAPMSASTPAVLKNESTMLKPASSSTSIPMTAKEFTTHMVDESSRTTLKCTDLLVSESCFMEDSDDLIKSFCSFEPDESSRTALKCTDLLVSGSCFMEDSDDLIKGFSSFEFDERSIDEIFDFKQSNV